MVLVQFACGERRPRRLARAAFGWGCWVVGWCYLLWGIGVSVGRGSRGLFPGSWAMSLGHQARLPTSAVSAGTRRVETTNEANMIPMDMPNPVCWVAWS